MFKKEAAFLTLRKATIRQLAPLLFVENVERSVAFYRDNLGFELTSKWEPEGKLAWCWLQRDGAAIMLEQASEEEGPTEGRGRGISFFFVCDDADAIHTELSGRGLALPAPQVAFYGMKQVFLKDPDGYELCFESPTDT